MKPGVNPIFVLVQQDLCHLENQQNDGHHGATGKKTHNPADNDAIAVTAGISVLIWPAAHESTLYRLALRSFQRHTRSPVFLSFFQRPRNCFTAPAPRSHTG